MSPVAQAMVLNGVVLFAVLESDFGPHRKIGRLRIARPLLMAAAIVPIYLTAFATSGMGLALELCGTAAGLLLGLLALSQLTIYKSPSTGKPVSRAGAGYAAVWVFVIGARAAFSYGSSHWFRDQLGNWMIHHSVTADAITDTLILMAITMVLTRTIGMITRSVAVRREPAATGVATDQAAAISTSCV